MVPALLGNGSGNNVLQRTGQERSPDEHEVLHGDFRRYRLADLIMGVVKSDAFRMKQATAADVDE